MNVVEIIQEMIQSTELTNKNSILKGMLLETDFEAKVNLDDAKALFEKGIFWFKFSVITNHILYQLPKKPGDKTAEIKAGDELTTKSIDNFDVVLKFVNRAISRDEKGNSTFYFYPTTTDSDCYVFCNCPHFYYYCRKGDSGILIKNSEVSRLFGISRFLKIDNEARKNPNGKVIKKGDQTRKSKNPRNEMGVCKHIIACINKLINSRASDIGGSLSEFKKKYEEFVKNNEDNKDGSSKIFTNKEGISWLDDESTILVDDNNDLDLLLKAGRSKFSLPEYLEDPDSYYGRYYLKRSKENFDTSRKQLLRIKRSINNAQNNIKDVKDSIIRVQNEIADLKQKKDFENLIVKRKVLNNLKRRLKNYNILLSPEKGAEVSNLEKKVKNLKSFFKQKQAVQTKKITDDKFAFVSDQIKDINTNLYRLTNFIDRCKKALKNEDDKDEILLIKQQQKQARSLYSKLSKEKEKIQAEIDKKRKENEKKAEERRKRQQEEKSHRSKRNELRTQNRSYFKKFSEADTELLVTDPYTEEKVSLVSLGKNVLETLNKVLRTGIKKDKFAAEELKTLKDLEDQLNKKYFEEGKKRIDEINKAGEDGHFVNDNSKKSKDFFLDQFNYLYNKNKSMLKDKINFIKNALNVIQALNERVRNKGDLDNIINSDEKIKSFINDAYKVLNSTLSQYGDESNYKTIVSTAEKQEAEDSKNNDHEDLTRHKEFDYGEAWKNIRNSIKYFSWRMIRLLKKEGITVKDSTKEVNDKLFYGDYGFEDLFRKYRDNNNRISINDLKDELSKNSALKKAIESYVKFFIEDENKRENINIDKLVDALSKSKNLSADANDDKDDKDNKKEKAKKDQKDKIKKIEEFKNKINKSLNSIVKQTLNNYFDKKNKKLNVEELYSNEFESLSVLAGTIAQNSFENYATDVKGAIHSYLNTLNSIILEAFKKRGISANEDKVKKLSLEILNK